MGFGQHQTCCEIQLNYESNPISIKLRRDSDTDKKNVWTLDNSRQTTILAKLVLDTRHANTFGPKASVLTKLPITGRDHKQSSKLLPMSDIVSEHSERVTECPSGVKISPEQTLTFYSGLCLASPAGGSCPVIFSDCPGI